MSAISIYDIPNIIKNTPLIFVGTIPGVVSLQYTKQDPRSIENDIDTLLVFVDLVDKYNIYVILEIMYSFKEKKVERFIILTNDHDTIKDKDEEWFLKIKKEVVEENTSGFDFISDPSYTIMESPELSEILDHWYELTNDDYMHRRYLTV